MPKKRVGKISTGNGKSANGTASTRCLATINLALPGICPVAPNRNSNFAWPQHFIQQSRTLATLRDTRQPKPLSGESSVTQAGLANSVKGIQTPAIRYDDRRPERAF